MPENIIQSLAHLEKEFVKFFNNKINEVYS